MFDSATVRLGIGPHSSYSMIVSAFKEVSRWKSDRFVHCCRRLKKDILMHVTDVASDYRRKADAHLPPTTERLLLENYQLNVRVADMYDEMRLLRQQSVEWKDEDDRQVKHMRQLAATNAHTTHTNITLAMVRARRHFVYLFIYLFIYIIKSYAKYTVNDKKETKMSVSF